MAQNEETCARCDEPATDLIYCYCHWLEYLDEWYCECGQMNVFPDYRCVKCDSEPS